MSILRQFTCVVLAILTLSLAACNTPRRARGCGCGMMEHPHGMKRL